jgi:predicted AlkP superfamily pyrophosphatase or phosphodiesterase
MRLFTLCFLFLFTIPLLAEEPKKPKLAVLIVFDQMRGDYVAKWDHLFCEDGFRRMKREGAWYSNCQYPYSSTATGPGHASLLSGCTPREHGIVGNNWYEPKRAANVYCASSDRYDRVPPFPPLLPDATKPTISLKKPEVGAPEKMMAPTVADVLAKATNNRSKIFGLSFKDRSAVLPVGRVATGAYWLDGTDGKMVTSTAYRDALHPWVAEFNQSPVAKQWFDKPWTRLSDVKTYDRNAGPDEVAGEGKGQKQGVSFPHPMNGGETKLGKAYYEALFNSPYGNDLLFELTKRCVIAEKLGQREDPDLLVVSFSSNDAIGHTWGPDSHEVLDVTLRSDLLMAEMLKFLDQQVGKGNYVLALSADHGICPLPEVSASKGLAAIRISGKELLAKAEAHLAEKFGAVESKEPKTSKYIEATSIPWIYLNDRLIKSKNLKMDVVAAELAAFLAKQEGIGSTYTRTQIESLSKREDKLLMQIQASYYPDRCGDVAVILAPYCLFDEKKEGTGTNHGTPHPYDTHVPLFFFGSGIVQGERTVEVPPQAIATVFSKVMGLNPPEKACFPIPKGVVKE